MPSAMFRGRRTWASEVPKTAMTVFLPGLCPEQRAHGLALVTVLGLVGGASLVGGAVLLAFGFAVGDACGETLSLLGERVLVVADQEQVPVLGGDAVPGSNVGAEPGSLLGLVRLLELGDALLSGLRALGLRLQLLVVRVLRL